MATKLQEKIRCEKDGVEFVDNTLATVGQTAESQHYVKNAELLKEIIWCKYNNDGNASDTLAKMFIRIATRAANKFIFPSPEDKQDVIYSAVGDCIKYFKNFDENKTTNAFAYVTSICKNGFAKGWRSLGYIKLPKSMRISLSDNLYSL